VKEEKATERLQQQLKRLQQRTAELEQAESEHKQAEKALEERANQLQIIGEVSRKVSSILNLDELLSYVIKAIQESFGYYHVDIFLIDQDQGYALFKASSNPTVEKVWKEQKLRFKLGEEGMIGWVSQSGEPLLANDVTKEPLYLPNKSLPETKSELVVPLKVEEQTFGVLDVQSSELDAFNVDDIFVLETLGNQVAIAIENAFLFERIEAALDALQVSKERFALAVQGANDGIWDWDIQKESLYWSPRMKQLLGYADDELDPEFEMLDSLLHPNDREHTKAAIEASLKDGRLYDVDQQMRTKSGEYRWFHARGQVIFDEVGKPVRMVGSTTDVTERKQAEERLKQERDRAQTYLDVAAVAMVALDRDGRITLVNHQAMAMLGYSEEELLGEDWFDTCLPERVRSHVHSVFEQLMSGEAEQTEYFENTVLRKGGEERIIAWKNGLLRDESGKIAGTLSSGLDITKRKRAEEELRASEQRYRLLFERNLAGVYRTTLDGRVLDCNKSYARIFGYDSQEEALARRASGLYFDAADREKFIAQLREQGTLINAEWCLRRKDGSPVWILENSSLIEGEEDAPTSIQGTLVDITKRKRAERLLQALNQAALAMGKAMRPEEIFTAVAEELKKLGFFCAVLLTDESQKRLFPKYLSYEAKTIKAAEKLVGLKAEDLPIPVETVEVYRKVIRERKTVFVENSEEVVRQFLPGPAKRLARQIAKMLKLSKSIDAPLIAEDEVIGLLLVQSDDLTEDDMPAITAFAHQMAAAWRKAQLMQDLEKSLVEVKRSQEELQRTAENLRRTLGTTIHAMALTVETRDPYTAGHQRRVADLACAIAREMGVPEERVEGLHAAGLVHDIGKVAIPAEILTKPAKLSSLEYLFIQAHPQQAYDILKDIDFPWPIADIVLQHHERMDGSGYPQGLKGKEIMLEARILAVADVIDAMASHRPYRPAFGIDKALEEISDNKGVLYDPGVAETCLRLFNEKGFKFSD